ncbi:hypothetical protein TIFTF001_008839 [Ficus carica]|uniref:Uncharacterized protein n=1 Tax=Ficus carica TaxID=3494 RepID=A0AA87ZT70_FICCA|nr:hypothetical protein TIFTF001_008839 [Ficus carica]
MIESHDGSSGHLVTHEIEPSWRQAILGRLGRVKSRRLAANGIDPASGDWNRADWWQMKLSRMATNRVETTSDKRNQAD